MANLVSPGYGRSALINEILRPVEERTIEFKGLNRNTVVEEGEMPDMWNLTADNYPVLMPRKPRGEAPIPNTIKRPTQVLRRFGKLALIALDRDNSWGFYYDNVRIDEVTQLSKISTAVAINNRMCFFPEKMCIDITKDGVQPGTYRPLEVDYDVTNLDVTISNEDARISLPVGHGLNYDDAIDIHISSYAPSGGSATSTDFDVSCNIEEVISGATEDVIVLPRETFIEMTGEGVTAFSITGNISRTMPDLDYIIEWNNRLWGCSNADNTIYACKLGDPFNWHYFQGTSLDSYYAEQGTDEKWTGIAEYSGHVIFFKPNSMTRVYGTAPSNYQITSTKVYGVEKGSSESVLTINDTVFYKSAIGIMAYRGGVPYCISEKLNKKFKNVVAGTEGTKYYASCLIDEGQSVIGRLLVFDLDRGLWHKEDDLRFTSACKIEDKVYCTTSTADLIVCDTDIMCAKDLMCCSPDRIESVTIINPDLPTEPSESIEWMAQFGPFDEYIEEHKIYSKLALRIKANGNASAKIYISTNEGPWEQVESYSEVSTKGDFIPIIPRRCDRYSVKIEGRGNFEIKSLTRRVRQGSFGRL